MDILAAIKREEKKLERQLGKLHHQLSGVRAAAEALGNTTNRQVNRELKVVKKRVLSAAGRAAIARAAKKRWAKVRKQARKAAG
jgi:regulator of replication initiation timing